MDQQFNQDRDQGRGVPRPQRPISVSPMHYQVRDTPTPAITPRVEGERLDTAQAADSLDKNALDDMLAYEHTIRSRNFIANHPRITIAAMLLLFIPLLAGIGGLMYQRISSKQAITPMVDSADAKLPVQTPTKANGDYLFTVNGQLKVADSTSFAKGVNVTGNSKFDGIVSAADLQAGRLNVDGPATINGQLTAAGFSGDGSGLTGVDAATLGGRSLQSILADINAARQSNTAVDVRGLQAQIDALQAASNDTAKLSADNTFAGNNVFNNGMTVQGNLSGQSAVFSTSVDALQFTQNGFEVCDTSGNCSLSTPGDAFLQNGNTFGVTAILGTNDNQALVLRTSGQARLTVAANGAVSVAGALSATSYSGDGSNLSNLNANNITSGTINDGRLSTEVTLQGNTFNAANKLVRLNATGALPSLDGANLSNVNAATLQGYAAAYFTDAGNLSVGTLSDARLSSNVPFKNANNTFTATNNFADLTATNILQNGNQVCDTSGNCPGYGNTTSNGTAGRVALFDGAHNIIDSIISQASTTVSVAGTLNAVALQGDGSLVTNLDAANIASGTLSVIRGGTGASTFLANAVLYGNGSGAIQSTNVGASNECLVGVSGGAPTFTSCPTAAAGATPGGSAGGDLGGTYPNPTVTGLRGTQLVVGGLAAGNVLLFNGTNWVNAAVSGDISVSASGVATIGNGVVTNGKLANSTLSVTAGNGLSGGGSVALGASTTLNVVYGNTASSAVAGNTNLTCAAGTGNLTGGGNNITLGAGGTCGSLNVIANPAFTSLTLTNALTVANGGTGAANALDARANLGAAASGANSDITSLSGLTTALSAAQGGTGINGSAAANGSLLIGNGSGFTLANLAQGSGISITNGVGSIQIAVDNTVCTTSGNCSSVGGGVTTAGGTAGTIALFTGTQAIGDSIISQSGSVISVAGTLSATALQGDGSGITDLNANNLTSGTVASARISGNYSGITGVGALTNGSIGSGFGTISTANTISTTAALQGNSLTIGSGAFTVNATGAITAATGITSSGTVTLSSLNAGGVVRASGTGALSTGTVALGSETTGNYVATLGTLTGLTTTGNTGAGSTPTLSVTYGAAVNTAAQGNTSLSFTGAGNLTGTVSGTAGGGFSSNTLNVVNNPTFSGLVTANGGLNATTLSASSTVTFSGLSTGIVQTNASGVVSSSTLDRNSSLLNGQTSVANGGTGANSASGARSNLGAAASGSNSDITSLNAVTSLSNSSGSLTVGDTGRALTLQGNASTVLSATDSGFLTSVGFAAPTANVNYLFQTAAAGTYNICTSAGNCAGAGGGVTTVGGTAGAIAYFTGSQTIANSLLSQAASTVTVAGTLSATALQGSGSAITNLNGSNIASGTVGVSVGGTGRGSFTSNGIVYGNGTGALQVTAAGQTGDCLVGNSGGAPYWTSCSGASGGGTPGGPAGGDLSGSYPNPTVAGLYGTALNISSLTSANILIYNGTNWVNAAVSGDLTVGASGVATIANGAVTNAKLQNSAVTVSAGNGLNGGGSVSLGGTTSLSVAYGSMANTAVQGNTSLTCTAGTGNLTGGGNSVTLGTGGTCGSLNVVASPSFTSLTLTNALTVANGGTGSTTASGARSNLGAAASGANSDITSISGLTTALSVGQGGTGLDASTAANGRLLIGNGSGFTLANLAQGSGISITNGAGSIQIAVDNTVCTTAGNCAGSGGGVSTAGGTVNTIALFTGAQAIGNSIITQSGTTINVAGTLSATSLQGDGSGISNLNASNLSSGTVASARISGSYTGITGVGALTAGSIGTGFGTISTGNNISTSAALQGNTLSIGSGAFMVNATGAITTATGITSSGTVTLSSLSTGVVKAGTGGVLTSGTVSLGSETSGNYVATLGTLTGLTTSGNTGGGSTPTLSVTYGAAASTAAQGNTALSFTGTGNLTGTVSGTAGGGFSSNTLNVVNNPTFSGLVTANGGLSATSVTASGTVTFSGLTAGIVQTNASGVVSSSSVDRNSMLLSGQTSVANGGTGSSTASGARSNLGAAASGANSDITSLTGVTSINNSSAGLAIGNLGQTLTLQGNAATSFQASDNGFTTTLNFQTPTANVTYRLPTAIAGTYDLCTTAGNCAGSAGGVTTAGGTVNTIALFTGSQAIGNSILTQAAGTITVGGGLTVTGAASLQSTLSVTGQITSLVATGTAPLVVASTTKVTNLNVDYLDGLDSTAFCQGTCAPNSNSGFYIQNTVTQQTGASFNIDGSGTIGTALSVGGNASVGGSLSVTSAVSASSLFTGGTQRIDNAGNLTNINNATIGGTTTFNGVVSVSAGQTITLVGGVTNTRPASPTEGMLYFDTTTKTLLIYQNGKWQADGKDAVLVAASSSSQSDKDAANYVADGDTGAAADGDQVQINQALTANAGKKVVLLAGTYTIDASVSVPNNTVLIGVGSGTVVELSDLDASANMIVNSDTSTGTGVVIQNLKLDGRSDLNTAGNQRAIFFSGMGNGSGSTARQGGRVTDVNVSRIRTGGIVLSGSANNTVTNNVVQSSGDDGISLTGSTSLNNVISSNRLYANINGIAMTSLASNNTISNNIAQGGTTSGISLSISSNNSITGNTLSGNSYGIFMASTSTGNSVSGNTAQGNSNYGFYTGSSSTNNTFNGNTAINNTNGGININSNNNTLVANNTQGGSYGIYIGGDNIAINGNTVSGATTNGILSLGAANATITGNRIIDSGGNTTNNGIYITTSGSTNNTVIGNTITDASATSNNFAINIQSTAPNTYLADNILGTGSINNASTTTVFGGQVNTAGNYQLQPSGTIELLKNTSITGTLGVSGVITSTVATGTAPLVVASTTMVSNLNVEYLNGQNGSYYRNASNINGGTLGVSYGGTGANSFTQYGILYGNGTGALGVTAAGTSGQCLLSGNGSAAPSWGACGQSTLQNVYDASSPATILLSNAKDFTINAADTATDPSILFNLSCTTCSTNGGRFAVQKAGTDVFTVNPDGNVRVGTVTDSLARLGIDGGNGAVTWVSRTAAQNNAWRSVTYGNGTYVAVSDNGTNRVMTSPDGITWTPRNATAAVQWTSVTYGNGLFVAVAYESNVMTSPDGITWTARTASDASYWRSVTYGNGRFVAVAEIFGANRAMTSTDGITWVSGTIPSTDWSSVTYGNGQFVAVSNLGSGTQVATSPDGITWTARTAPVTQWMSVTYGNGQFVAVASSGTNRVMTSPDGITWTARNAAENNYWTSVTYGNGLFVAVAFNAPNGVMTSPDGITWTARAVPEAAQWFSVVYGNGQFVSVSYTGTNRVMTSVGGQAVSVRGESALQGDLTVSGSTRVNGTLDIGNKLNIMGSLTSLQSATFRSSTNSTTSFQVQNSTGWTLFNADTVNQQIAIGFDASTPGVSNRLAVQGTDGASAWTPRTAAEANSWQAITYGNGLYVAVAYDGTNRVMTSPDGITWTPRTAAEANFWTSITYGNGLFVAVAISGTNRVMTSPDGITWTPRTAAEATSWQSVTYGNGQFVAVANNGTNRVMTSPDGITWTPRTAAEANGWASVTYGNGLYVAIANSGTNQVMTSPDGITWTPRTAAAANGWTSITYGNGRFVAVSNTGTNRVMTSPDGITWTPRTAAAANGWASVTYGNGLFVAVSDSGTNQVMTSPDGITWTPRIAAAANIWTSITYGNGQFVSVANNGTNRVMTSPDSRALYAGGSTSLQGNVAVRGEASFNLDGQAFLIQNASANLFSVQQNGDIRIGSATNGITFVAANGFKLTATGSARNSKSIRLAAEYPGAVLDTGATGNNLGTMTSGYDMTNRMNYYLWTTTQTSGTYDIVVQIPIPKDFDGWDGATPFTVSAYQLPGSSASMQVIKSNGATDTNFSTFQFVTDNPNTWGPKSFALNSSGYTAGDYMTVRIRMYSENGSSGTKMGNIVLNYLSNKQ